MRTNTPFNDDNAVELIVTGCCNTIETSNIPK